jgi:ribosomal protein S18 acetylase RimI-like enzyme
MVGIVDRPYEGARDLERAADLLIALRVRAGKDRAPTAKRLALLATSRLWEPEQDARVWEANPIRDTPDGGLEGFTLLWRREPSSPCLTLELVTRRDSVIATETPSNLTREMVEWALERAAALAARMRADVTLGVATFADQSELQTLLRGRGFVLQDGHNVYMTCALGDAIPSTDAPDGVTIRPLRGASELERYGALYGFTPMSLHHRLELLLSPDYIHLVAIKSDNDFVAYCESSIDREEWARGGRQTGWVEYVGVRQDMQGRGLGRAIVGEGLRWLRSHGAQTAALVTMGTNGAAQRLYQAVGFRISERDYSYMREAGSTAP